LRETLRVMRLAAWLISHGVERIVGNVFTQRLPSFVFFSPSLTFERFLFLTERFKCLNAYVQTNSNCTTCQYVYSVNRRTGINDIISLLLFEKYFSLEFTISACYFDVLKIKIHWEFWKKDKKNWIYVSLWPRVSVQLTRRESRIKFKRGFRVFHCMRNLNCHFVAKRSRYRAHRVQTRKASHNHEHYLVAAEVTACRVRYRDRAFSYLLITGCCVDRTLFGQEAIPWPHRFTFGIEWRRP